MAIRADFHVQFGFGAAGREYVAAGADDLGVGMVLGMDVLLHGTG